MKKLAVLILMMALMASLFAGCGGSPAAEPEKNKTEPGENEDVLDYSNVKIGILFDNFVTTEGWQKEQYDSIMKVKENLALSDDQVLVVENVQAGTPDVDSTILQMAEGGCNIIIGTSSGYATQMTPYAEKNPDIYFLSFEGKTMDNYAAYTVNEIGAVFVLGYAAALMSESDRLGFVACFPQASLVRFIDAWAQGAKTANPNATVEVLWSNSWFDPAADKECANALLDEGITSIGYYGSTTAVAAACEEQGAYCTGLAESLHGAAPNAVLNTFAWDWSGLYQQAITDIVSGNWSSETKVGSAADGTATIRQWNDTVMPQDVIDQCDQMFEKVKSGEQPVLEGPLFDNQGNQVLAEGEQFTLEELMGCSFLLDNVIGSLT